MNFLAEKDSTASRKRWTGMIYWCSSIKNNIGFKTIQILYHPNPLLMCIIPVAKSKKWQVKNEMAGQNILWFCYI